jgi:hypothetical protein
MLKRSSKRTAPPQASKKVSTPPPKNAKASLTTRPIFPESASASQVLPSPLELFQEANRKVQEAWKVAFPSLRFPVELIGIYPHPKLSLLECHSNNIKKNHHH